VCIPFIIDTLTRSINIIPIELLIITNKHGVKVKQIKYHSITMDRTRPVTSTRILWTAVSLVAVVSMTAILFGNSHLRKKVAAGKQRRIINKKRNKSKETLEDTSRLSRVLQLRIQALTIPGIVNLGNTCFMAAVIQVNNIVIIRILILDGTYYLLDTRH
jgi:hypothetical protein